MERIVTIDAAGRLVVPKEVRDRLGLAQGGRLLLTEDGSRLVLEAVGSGPELVEEEGVLVVADPLVGEVPDHRDLREDRAGRHWSGS